MSAATPMKVLSVEAHEAIAHKVMTRWGFSESECRSAVDHFRRATKNGVFSHGFLRYDHLLHKLLVSGQKGCVGNRCISKVKSRFKAVESWDAHGKIGIAVAEAAMRQAVQLAKRYGTGMVQVHNVGHYLWGGDYVLRAARDGMIARTYCTAALAEVLPTGGKTPTLGTNPLSMAFPTKRLIGYPVLIDFATSASSMGKIQAAARSGEQIPPGTAVDAEGNETLDPALVKALLTFGGYKGYGLSVVTEIMAAYSGGSLPTMRCRWDQGDESDPHTSTFFFEAIHPEALLPKKFACGRSQDENVLAVLQDIVGTKEAPNGTARLPGLSKWEKRLRCKKNGGLVIPFADAVAISEKAREVGIVFKAATLKDAA